MTRNSIPTNISRQLWAQCGGFCQNPNCNRNLFHSLENTTISIANVAHIIGHGKTGPRTEHDLADFIEKNGFDNLIMLCLICHKAVDELPHHFTVEQMMDWKLTHGTKVKELFSTPLISNETELLTQVHELLEENGLIFSEYGPYSHNALSGESSGDSLLLWRKLSLEKILPNNRRIISLIERNKKNFGFPWEVYRMMLTYKLHVEAFQDNCLQTHRVNDYKLFPKDFHDFIKIRLGIEEAKPSRNQQDELDFRKSQIQAYTSNILAKHGAIKNIEELNIATMIVNLVDGRSLRVFVTNSYFFSDYTLEKILAIDPSIDAIICSSPYSSYSPSAKRSCIQLNIGLFMIGEFMGAIRKQGEDFTNYLLNRERDGRIHKLSDSLRRVELPNTFSIFVFGSYLRRNIFNDIDLLIVYPDSTSKSFIDSIEHKVRQAPTFTNNSLDITTCSESEQSHFRLKYDNLTKVHPTPRNESRDPIRFW